MHVCVSLESCSTSRRVLIGCSQPNDVFVVPHTIKLGVTELETSTQNQSTSIYMQVFIAWSKGCAECHIYIYTVIINTWHIFIETISFCCFSWHLIFSLCTYYFTPTQRSVVSLLVWFIRKTNMKLHVGRKSATLQSDKLNNLKFIFSRKKAEIDFKKICNHGYTSGVDMQF